MDEDKFKEYLDGRLDVVDQEMQRSNYRFQVAFWLGRMSLLASLYEIIDNNGFQEDD